MKVVSSNIFVKMKANALTSEEFTEFIEKNGINEFFVAGADATACLYSLYKQVVLVYNPVERRCLKVED